MQTRLNKAISVIGGGRAEARQLETARTLGRLLAEAGYDIVCGGLGGIMAAACRGARDAGGRTIGILPGNDRAAANEHVSVAIATGLGQMRNHLVVINGEAAVAVWGGAGTLSEIGLALKAGREVVAIGTWDSIPGVHRAADAAQAVELITKLIQRR